MKRKGWTCAAIVGIALLMILPSASFLAALNFPAKPAALDASNSVTLRGGYQIPVAGGQAALERALAGGPFSSINDGPAAYRAWVANTSPAYSSQISSIPLSVWAGLQKESRDAQAKMPESVLYADVQSALHTDVLAPFGFGTAIIVIITVTALGCLFGGPIGCLVGLAVAGVFVAAWFIVSNLFGNQDAQHRLDAQQHMGAFMGGIHGILENNANSTRTILNDLNLTYTALTWEAANAALTQLPNSSFNFPLDAFQSGILPQLMSTIEGVIANMANTVAAGLDATAREFGPQGFYGTQGIACTMRVQAGSFVGPTITDPNLYMGFSPQSPACYGETGSPGNEEWSGTVNPTVTPGVFPGLAVSTAGTFGSHSISTEYYIPHGAALDAPFVYTGGAFTNGPYVALQFVPIFGSGVTWYNYTSGDAAFNFTGPSGIYYLNSEAACSTRLVASCSPLGGSVHGVQWIVVGAVPLNSATVSGSTLAASFNATGPFSGQFINVVALNCPNNGVLTAGSTGSTLYADQTNIPSFEVCDYSSDYTLTEMSTLTNAAVNVGEAYWSFLRLQGYTNENQVPTRCVIPNPAEIIAPNVNGGAAYLASLNLTDLLGLYIGYLSTLSYTFNETQNLTNSSFGGFCGHVIKCPTLTGSCVGFGVWGLGRNVPVFALGDIYVPPAQCVADLGQACNGETISNVSSWVLQDVQQLWEPSTGTLNLTINQSVVLPHANPSSLVYNQNNTAGDAMTCLTMAHNAVQCNATNPVGAYGRPTFQYHVTGNSTDKGGSIYAQAVNPAFGAGWMVRINACATLSATNFTGNWSQLQNYTKQTSVCQFNESLIQSWITNTSCINGNVGCGHCPPNCPPPGGGGGTHCAGDATFLLGSIVDSIATVIGFGNIGCLLGWGIVIFLVVALVSVIVYVPIAIYTGRRD